jgi:hypothetical protein
MVVKMENTTAQVILVPEALQRASAIAEEFKRAGFTTGTFVANNFSIAGTRELFESYFGMPSAQTSDTSQERELPLGTLSPELQSAVQAIVMTRRPDFGPGNF